MRKRGLAVAVVGLMALSAANAASAQGHGARFTLGGGAGVSLPFHGDFDFNAAGWEVAGRGRPAEHLSIEGFASGWRHSSATTRTGVQLEGPGGRLGTVGQLAQRTTDQTLAFGVSLLPTFQAGRATILLGGGGNVMFFQHRYEQQLTGCVSSSPVSCGSFATARTASDVGAHVTTGIDVRLTGRLIAFGQFRALVPLRDPGAGHSAAIAGMRLALR